MVRVGHDRHAVRAAHCCGRAFLLASINKFYEYESNYKYLSSQISTHMYRIRVSYAANVSAPNTGRRTAPSTGDTCTVS
jgi:hypothetical protein